MAWWTPVKVRTCSLKIMSLARGCLRTGGCRPDHRPFNIAVREQPSHHRAKHWFGPFPFPPKSFLVTVIEGCLREPSQSELGCVRRLILRRFAFISSTSPDARLWNDWMSAPLCGLIRARFFQATRPVDWLTERYTLPGGEVTVFCSGPACSSFDGFSPTHPSLTPPRHVHPPMIRAVAATNGSWISPALP